MRATRAAIKPRRRGGLARKSGHSGLSIDTMRSHLSRLLRILAEAVNSPDTRVVLLAVEIIRSQGALLDQMADDNGRPGGLAP
jgi:hypothetical protein